MVNISRLGRALGYLGATVGFAVTAMYVASLAETETTALVPYLWSIAMLGVSVIAVYAVRMRRLLLVWPIAFAFGAFSLVTLQSRIVSLGTVLYVLAAMVLTVDNLSDTPIGNSLPDIR